MYLNGVLGDPFQDCFAGSRYKGAEPLMSSRAFLDARELSDVLERKLNDDGAPQRDVGVARKDDSLLAHPQPSLHGNAKSR